MPVAAARTRPTRARNGHTTEVTIGDLTVNLTITVLPDGQPGEIFLRAGKQGSTLAGLCEALSLTTSLALQHGVPLDEIVTRLRGMRYEPSGLTSDPDIPRVTSLSDYLARRLTADYLTETASVVDRTATSAHQVIRLPELLPAKQASRAMSTLVSAIQ